MEKDTGEDISENKQENPINQDFYIENGMFTMKEAAHLKRGKCCGNKCRHCPYIPLHHKGSKTTKYEQT